MSAFGRVGTIFGGCIAACAATAATALLIVPDAAIGCDKVTVCSLVFVLTLGVALSVAALPMLLLVLYTESRSVRALPVYLCFGIVLAALPFMRAPLIKTAGSFLDWQLVPIALAGAAGGLAYWLIAGRRAGDWPSPEGAS